MGLRFRLKSFPTGEPPAKTVGVMRNVILFLCLLNLGNGHLAPRFNRQPDGSIRSVIAGKKCDCFARGLVKT